MMAGAASGPADGQGSQGRHVHDPMGAVGRGYNTLQTGGGGGRVSEKGAALLADHTIYQNQPTLIFLKNSSHPPLWANSMTHTDPPE